MQSCPALAQQVAPDRLPAVLSFEELKQLSEPNSFTGSVAEKAERILNTPFISNAAERLGVTPIHLKDPELGVYSRAAQWNIERGMNLDLIKLIFQDRETFKSKFDRKEYQPGTSGYEEAIQQAEILRNTSILILNEVDLGMPRTDYRNVVAEFAEAARMNYVYGVEFFEIDKLQLGTEELGEDDEEKAEFRKMLAPDPERYKGLHGSAILSKYPILAARVVPLKRQCYDWYHEELKKASALEGAKREVADRVFLEKIFREVRRGGRTLVMADLYVPELPENKVTVINVHLENRGKPSCREDQMKEVLALIQPITNPVIMAGDLNTSGSDATPTSFKRELKKRYKDPHFWGAQAIKHLTPVGLTLDAAQLGFGFAKIERDPTADKIPILAPRTEGELFDEVEDFRFSDGRAFDFRGDKSRTVDDRDKKLANSNERAKVGFKPTYEFERSFENTVGEFKLDWFFVKSYITDPKAEGQSYKFAPHFARTLDDVNSAIEDRISDHHPITVDLPLGETRLATGKNKAKKSLFRMLRGIF
jgi:endonuclease/exonuclease/phosphatase family metal-dependent hydrolase